MQTILQRTFYIIIKIYKDNYLSIFNIFILIFKTYNESSDSLFTRNNHCYNSSYEYLIRIKMAHFYIIFLLLLDRSTIKIQFPSFNLEKYQCQRRNSIEFWHHYRNWEFYTRRELKFDSLGLKWLLHLIVRRIDWVKSRIHRREGINQFSRKLHVETVVIKRIAFLFRMIRSTNKQPLERKRRDYFVNSIDWWIARKNEFLSLFNLPRKKFQHDFLSKIFSLPQFFFNLVLWKIKKTCSSIKLDLKNSKNQDLLKF